MAGKKAIAVPTNEPEPVADEALLRSCAFTMEKWFRVGKSLGLTTAATKEEFYKCQVSDVIDVAVRPVGRAEALYFILRDGRVLDCLAHEQDLNSLPKPPTFH